MMCFYKGWIGGSAQLVKIGLEILSANLKYLVFKHRKNWECCLVSQFIVRYYLLNKDCHEFRFSIVRILISVSNVTSLQDSLFVKIGKNCKKIVKIVDNCQNCQDCWNGQNCQKSSTLLKIIKIVKIVKTLKKFQKLSKLSKIFKHF